MNDLKKKPKHTKSIEFEAFKRSTYIFFFVLCILTLSQTNINVTMLNNITKVLTSSVYLTTPPMPLSGSVAVTLNISEDKLAFYKETVFFLLYILSLLL